MIVKMMSQENAPDDDSRKTYRIVSDVKTVEFVRKMAAGKDTDEGIAVLEMKDGSWQEAHLYGNAYVMNDAGKTVSSFGVAQLDPTDI